MQTASRSIGCHDPRRREPDDRWLHGTGTPERLIDEIVRQNKRDLTVIASTAAPGRGIGKPIDAAVRKAIVSHIGLNPVTQRQMMARELEVDLVPQGTLIERIRAGGYGLGGILTPTGVGTTVEDGKQRIDVDGKSYLLEVALRADFALVHAFLADYLGNLSYALTARNFNPVIAMAGATVIASADNIVPLGVISPDHVVTPAPLVDYLIPTREDQMEPQAIIAPTPGAFTGNAGDRHRSDLVANYRRRQGFSSPRTADRHQRARKRLAHPTLTNAAAARRAARRQHIRQRNVVWPHSRRHAPDLLAPCGRQTTAGQS